MDNVGVLPLDNGAVIKMVLFIVAVEDHSTSNYILLTCVVLPIAHGVFSKQNYDIRNQWNLSEEKEFPAIEKLPIICLFSNSSFFIIAMCARNNSRPIADEIWYNRK